MDILRKRDVVRRRFQYAVLNGDSLCLTWPIYYEIRRGLIHKAAEGQAQRFEGVILPIVRFFSILDSDWERAAQLWAALQRAGRTLSDIDILIATVALRTGATLVSADADFRAVPDLRHADWRAPFAES